GYTAPQEGPFENVDYYQTVTLEYITTMGIPVVDGRDFAATDVTGGPVALVNETLARTFYKGQSPVGRRVRPGFNEKIPWFTIAGVVKDVKQGGIASKTGTELYFLADQLPRIRSQGPGNMNVVVRSSLPVESLAAGVRQLVRQADPTLPIVRLRTMDDVFAESVSRQRFVAQLLGLFAGLALALAAVGTYGILAYSVSQRRKEIGIHMALGATRTTVLRMILGQGMRLTIIGLVAGVAGALAVTRVLQAQLFNVRPTDPLTITSVALFIAAVASVACLVPANRAARVDPMVVLRDE
ncbi:MAG: FtsX-like permease family protein, partial [Vicinamibacterales bacterium]